MSIVNSNVSITGHVERYIGTAYDTVKFVADNMDSILELGNIEDLAGLADQIEQDALTASNSAAAAKVSETTAKTSENNAKASENNASDSEAVAIASAEAAQTAETNAKNSETTAGGSASLATTKANESSASADLSGTSRDDSNLWATEAVDITVNDGVNPPGFSAFHWSEKAKDNNTGGEANVTLNLGTGEGLALPKPAATVDLPFKTLKVTGSGSISSDTDSVTIDITSNTLHANLTDVSDVDLHPISAITGLQSSLDSKVVTNSPTFTGIPITPTPTAGDNTTWVANTQFVQNEIVNKADINYVDSAVSLKSDTTYVDNELLSKADISYVDARVGLVNKNYLINPTFRVNQREFAGGALADGEYGFDRWKAVGASEMSHTGLIRLTVQAGSVRQVVEDFQYTGELTVSWKGSSLLDGVRPSPYTFNTTGGDVPLTFGIGTLSEVKLEIGDVNTVFQYAAKEDEISKCLPYYTVVSVGGDTSTSAISTVGWTASYQMRDVPTVVKVTDLAISPNMPVGTVNDFVNVTKNGARCSRTTTAADSSTFFFATYALESEL